MYETVLRLDPDAAPEGDYFDSGTPDRGRENRYFPGWYNDMTPWGYRNQLSHLQVAHDAALGARVLEWKRMHVRYLLNTDPFGADLRIRARLCTPVAECVEYHDIPDCTESRLGVVLRYEDHRHFYFCALEGLRRLVIYRRDDDEWQVLAAAALDIDPARYYELDVEALGDCISCICGGQRIWATDSRYARGRCGIRGNSLGKVAGVEVAMSPGQRRYNEILRANYQRELDAVRAEYPGLIEAKRLDLRAFGAEEVELLPLRDDRRPDLLLKRCDGEQVRVTAVDWDGEVLWERDDPLVDGSYAVFREGADGRRQLVVLRDDRFAIIDLATGRQVDEKPFPHPIKHQLRVLPAGLADRPGNARGRGQPDDMLLRYCDAPQFDDDAVRLMLLDEECGEIWSVDSESLGMGHTHAAQFFDVDGDGRDEVLASCRLLSPTGETLWRMEAIADIEGRPGARHIDFAVIGDFAGDQELDPTVFACAGGVYVVDGRSGRTRAHHCCGHTQGGKIGNFRPELPGLELAGRNRWGSMGIVPFVNGRGSLLGRMHPDPIGHPGGPVNWTGDGQELVFIGSYRGLGLYDGHGRKVVELPAAWCNEDNFKGARPNLAFADVLGDPREELIHSFGGVVTVYTQDRPPSDPGRIYAPRRRGILSLPHWA